MYFYCSFDFRPAIFIVRSISVLDNARPARYVLPNTPYNDARIIGMTTTWD
jgi:hypothetical protein